MEDESKKPEVKEKKPKKKGNKPSGQPVGRSRAKSTVLANFQKNTMANKLNDQDSKKAIDTGVTQDRFKNLLGMFDKKPEDSNKEKEKPSFQKMNTDRFAMFNKNNNTTDNKPTTGFNQGGGMSIKDRMAKLMQSKEDNKTVKKVDPILERLRENRNDDDDDYDEDEDSYDDELSEEDNLDISEGGKENDDLDKSESLSEEKKEVKDEKSESLSEEKKESKEEVNNEVEVLKSIGSNEEENQPEKENLNNDEKKENPSSEEAGKKEVIENKEIEKKVDLNKSEELDD